VAAFTPRHELKAYLRRRLDAFINPLVYTFGDDQITPSVMTMTAAVADGSEAPLQRQSRQPVRQGVRRRLTE
jgi:hypothetical protein